MLRIDILVRENALYSSTDCGITASFLQEKIADYDNVFIHKLDDGDPFCYVLNYGLKVHDDMGIDYSFILSYQARGYLNDSLWSRIEGLIKQWTKVMGVAIPELKELIHDGLIQNTFAIWNTREIINIGGFDLRAKKEENINEEIGFTGGCEEIFPLVKLSEIYLEEKFIGIVTIDSQLNLYDSWDNEINKMKFNSKKRRLQYYQDRYGIQWGDLKKSILVSE